MKKLLLFLFTPLAAFGQVNYSSSIEKLMAAQCKVKNFNGNVLVARSGNIVYQRAFGYSNYDTKAQLDNNSVFELGSISKQFTAVGILMLVEKGKLHLTDSLRKFFPELPYHNITIQNLLTHTSGLPDYQDAMQNKWNSEKVAFNEDMIGFLASDKTPADFAPNKKWEYSNTAYAILASIIEKISGMSYAHYLSDEVFKPLDMRRTRIYNTRRSLRDTIANYAYGFVYADSLKKYMLPDSLKALDFVYYLDGIVGDGTVNSTTGDLLKWDRALKNHTLLSERMQHQMLSPQAIVDTVGKFYYGYGEFLGKDMFSDVISHSGDWPGYFTMLTRYPVEDITIIVLSNNESDATGISLSLAAIMFGQQVLPPYIHRRAIIDTAVLDRYIGVYRNNVVSLEILGKDGKLFRRRAGVKDIELVPESATKLYFSDRTDRQVEFETNTAGDKIKCWYLNSGVKMEMKKD